jgi:hypothetical protein
VGRGAWAGAGMWGQVSGCFLTRAGGGSGVVGAGLGMFKRVQAPARAGGGSGAVGRVFWRVRGLWGRCLARAGAVLWGACFGACVGCGAGVWRWRKRCCGARVLTRARAVGRVLARAGAVLGDACFFWRLCRRCSGCLARAGAVLWRVFWRVRGLWGGCLARGWERCCGARVLARV